MSRFKSTSLTNTSKNTNLNCFQRELYSKMADIMCNLNTWNGYIWWDGRKQYYLLLNKSFDFLAPMDIMILIYFYLTELYFMYSFNHTLYIALPNYSVLAQFYWRFYWQTEKSHSMTAFIANYSLDAVSQQLTILHDAPSLDIQFCAKPSIFEHPFEHPVTIQCHLTVTIDHSVKNIHSRILKVWKWIKFIEENYSMDQLLQLDDAEECNIDNNDNNLKNTFEVSNFDPFKPYKDSTSMFWHSKYMLPNLQ